LFMWKPTLGYDILYNINTRRFVYMRFGFLTRS